MTLELLFGWNNLIFIMPFVLGLLYLGMYTFSGWTFGDADAGIDHNLNADLDHDADLSHDVESSADADTDANTDTDADGHDAESNEAQGSAFLSVLNWIGIGRMPVSLVLMILMLCWGTIGFSTNQLLLDYAPMRAVVIAIAAAGVGSACITHFVSAILGNALFNTTNVPRRRHELLGSRAEALYPIDQKFGMVCGRDDRGALFQVPCRVEHGQQPVAKGSPVQLVGYSSAEQMFFVVPAENAVTPRMKK